jgi:hypothetical protein
MIALMIVKAKTQPATITSDFVMFSFLYEGDMSGPQALNGTFSRNSSFIAEEGRGFELLWPLGPPQVANGYCL